MNDDLIYLPDGPPPEKKEKKPESFGIIDLTGLELKVAAAIKEDVDKRTVARAVKRIIAAIRKHNKEVKKEQEEEPKEPFVRRRNGQSRTS